jgi:DNA polymerase III subunit delta'
MPLDGLRGHSELLAQLVREIARRPAHAYLFSGPRGIGKALVARALAHGLLCERSPGPRFCCTPDRCPTRINAAAVRRAPGGPTGVARCNCCSACVQVALAVHPDFIYVARQPGRTDILIEQVRDLIERLAIRPSRAPMRVAIIDDADTLNIPAQNALLKTLEEPPGYTIIFLIAQSERVLLETVRSRLRPARFGPLSTPDVEALLIEHGRADPARASAIARLARGSAGRAMALAEGAEPPMKELLQAIAGTQGLDFAEAHRLAQEFFASREQAVDNFELIARLLEEMLCFKLLRTEFTTWAPEVAEMMAKLADRLAVESIVNSLDAALKAAVAVGAMANSRLQAEQWWMTVGRALRRE